MQLTTHQQTIADAIINDTSPSITLSGLAGTGKTTLTKYLYDHWSRSQTVIALAPTGKACQVLTSKGVPSVTIHHAIYKFRGEYEDINGDKILIFKDNKNGRFCDRLLIDEASMCTEQMQKDIEARGIPCVYVGDPGQLPPVKARAANVFNRTAYVLREIHRQAADSPVIQYAYRMRKGESLKERHQGIEHREVNGRGAMYIVGQMLDHGIDKIICRTNAQRVAINDAYRMALGRNDLICPGDEITICMNNRNYGIVNGECFIVKSITSQDGVHTRVTTTCGRSIKLLNAQFGMERKIDEKVDPWTALADYGYAITCHKAQGSSWKHIGIAARGADGFDDSCRWNYTAVTRAEQQLTVFA
jgi:exodeoxyribonuclease V